MAARGPVEVTRAGSPSYGESELLATRGRGSAPGGVSPAAPYRHLENRTVRFSAAAAAVDELRDRGVGDGDEVP